MSVWAYGKRRHSGRRELSEFERIERLLKPLARGFEPARELEDDAAVLAPPRGHEFVVSCDTVVGGVHFFPDDPPAQIAKKALRVNLSDLAAKGAEPYAYIMSLALPPAIDDAWLALFCSGLSEDQEEFKIHLAGGDSVSTPGPVTITITVFGLVPLGGMVPRTGSKPGDGVLVTGTIGDSWLGLNVLRGKRDFIDPDNRKDVIERYRVPRPRTRIVELLREHAVAAVDVSDGLLADMRHLTRERHCGFEINVAALPLSLAARSALRQEPELVEHLVTGGDDYEVLTVVPQDRIEQFIREAWNFRVPVTEIGRAVPPQEETASVRLFREDGSELIPAGSGGWVHG